MKLVVIDHQSVEKLFETQYPFDTAWVTGNQAVTTQHIGRDINQMDKNDIFIVFV
ncbi:hypothetical protein PEC301899_17680 [Pectobacterium carotovorum subsp. carotovorum]|nr:hypothetical protein PEC301899_17680 [Pectobacterium carotovorum subsp. carotovorum]